MGEGSGNKSWEQMKDASLRSGVSRRSKEGDPKRVEFAAPQHVLPVRHVEESVPVSADTLKDRNRTRSKKFGVEKKEVPPKVIRKSAPLHDIVEEPVELIIPGVSSEIESVPVEVSSQPQDTMAPPTEDTARIVGFVDLPVLNPQPEPKLKLKPVKKFRKTDDSETPNQPTYLPETVTKRDRRNFQHGGTTVKGNPLKGDFMNLSQEESDALRYKDYNHRPQPQGKGREIGRRRHLENVVTKEEVVERLSQDETLQTEPYGHLLASRVASERKKIVGGNKRTALPDPQNARRERERNESKEYLRVLQEKFLEKEALRKKKEISSEYSMEKKWASWGKTNPEVDAREKRSIEMGRERKKFEQKLVGDILEFGLATVDMYKLVDQLFPELFDAFALNSGTGEGQRVEQRARSLFSTGILSKETKGGKFVSDIIDEYNQIVYQFLSDHEKTLRESPDMPRVMTIENMFLDIYRTVFLNPKIFETINGETILEKLTEQLQELVGVRFREVWVRTHGPVTEERIEKEKYNQDRRELLSKIKNLFAQLKNFN